MGDRRAARIVPALLVAGTVAVLVAVLIAVVGVGGDGSTDTETSRAGGSEPAERREGLARYYDQRVEWERCGRTECGTVYVPLDYGDPDGEQIGLAVRRSAATGQRIGSLVVNPGGPGEPVRFSPGTPTGCSRPR